MNIRDTNTGVILAENAKIADTFFSRMRGLMFTPEVRALVLAVSYPSIAGTSLHMWFMSYPIDMIWLDHGMKVVDLFASAQPWAFRSFSPRSPALYVVECQAGTIERTHIELGHVLAFQ